ncbi:hypothetical protein D3C78_1263150 [compost metagenome]
MKKLRKSLISLVLGELAAALVFLIVYFNHFNFGMASLLALIYLVFILLQGSAYWLFRALYLKREKLLSIRLMLHILRITNMLLACIVLVLMIILAQNKNDIIVGILIFVFSIIEYVNYYWYRLSYGKSGFNLRLLFQSGLQPSSIHKLLK